MINVDPAHVMRYGYVVANYFWNVDDVSEGIGNEI